jgi:hypothetical protein
MRCTCARCTRCSDRVEGRSRRARLRRRESAHASTRPARFRHRHRHAARSPAQRARRDRRSAHRRPRARERTAGAADRRRRARRRRRRRTRLPRWVAVAAGQHQVRVEGGRVDAGRHRDRTWPAGRCRPADRAAAAGGPAGRPGPATRGRDDRPPAVDAGGTRADVGRQLRALGIRPELGTRRAGPALRRRTCCRRSSRARPAAARWHSRTTGSRRSPDSRSPAGTGTRRASISAATRCR